MISRKGFLYFNSRLKWFLLIEPFASTIITFGGIYLLWLELTWVKYIIMFSGFLITTSYILQKENELSWKMTVLKLPN